MNMKKLFLMSVLSLVSLSGMIAQEQTGVQLMTGDQIVEVLPDRFWTFRQISYDGAVIAVPRGFYGLVIAVGPAKFIGTGHDEGGMEELKSVRLLVDGKEQELDQMEYQGEEIILEKVSQVGPFEHHAVTTLKNGRIHLKHSLEAQDSAYMELIYPFMLCWTPETTEWTAETVGGEILSGEFVSDQGWELQQSVLWSAVYDPTNTLIAKVEFGEDFPEGKIHKHAFWDQPHYHKQYFQSHFQETVTEGDVFEYECTVGFIKASPENWKERAQENLEVQ